MTIGVLNSDRQETWGDKCMSYSRHIQVIKYLGIVQGYEYMCREAQAVVAGLAGGGWNNASKQLAKAALQVATGDIQQV